MDFLPRDLHYILGGQIAVEYAKIASEHQNGKNVSYKPNQISILIDAVPSIVTVISARILPHRWSRNPSK